MFAKLWCMLLLLILTPLTWAQQCYTPTYVTPTYYQPTYNYYTPGYAAYTYYGSQIYNGHVWPAGYYAWIAGNWYLAGTGFIQGQPVATNIPGNSGLSIEDTVKLRLLLQSLQLNLQQTPAASTK